MRRFRKSTIKDVAARSGVSTTTISNFVSGNVRVCSPDTAERIREAISALHYVPSSLTRGLHQRASSTIGVCLPYPLDQDVRFGAWFLERLWRGIVAAADAEGYSLLHYPVAVRESVQCDSFLDGRVDGLLLNAGDNQRAVRLAAAGMPTVLPTRSLDLPDGCGAVWADEARTLDLALRHLWELGHRRIAHIAGPVGAAAGIDNANPRRSADIAVRRLDAFADWMRTRDAYDPDLVEYSDGWRAPRSHEYLQAWRVLPSPPTAVLCANDAQALDLIDAARGCGLFVPEDLSIVGVDNSPEASLSTPTLTTVDVPLERVGAEAVNVLLRMMTGAPMEQCRVSVTVTQIAVRNSTCPPKA